MTRVLVTGANGFVGRAVCRRLKADGHHVAAAVRDESVSIEADDVRYVGDLGETRQLDQCVVGAEAVVHLAARVHVMRDPVADAEATYERINVDVTKRLAEASVRQGVKRFVFLSSIKVNGEKTDQAPFTERDHPDPQDAYGRSKWDAERYLIDVASGQGLEPVILRAPLVYGPAVKANFLSLLRLCDSPLPLPLGSISENRRSLIYVENLADAITLAVGHSNAVRQTFLVSDGEPVSTASLVGSIRSALGRPARLIPFSPICLRFLLSLVGKSVAADRLTDSLAIDNSRIRKQLGWSPPMTFEEGLAATAAWYRQAT